MMAGPEIKPELRQFLFEFIDSVEQLEILLLLAATPTHWWTAQEITASIRSTQSSVDARVKNLKRVSLLKEDDAEPGKFQYAPDGPASPTLLLELAECYKVLRHRVLEIIFSPLKKARAFADAFQMVSSSGTEEKDPPVIPTKERKPSDA